MKKIISAVAASAILATAGMAVSEISKNGRGNYLVTPAYFSGGGYETQFEVYNTNYERAVVAKVVIREAKCSQELKDFLIFLSPGDVFTAKVAYDSTDGKVKVYSEDDSVDTGTRGNGGTTVTAAKGFLKSGQDLLAGSRFADTKVFNLTTDTTKKINAFAGYIEVFPLVELNASAIKGSTFSVGEQLSKAKMVKFYDEMTKALEGEGLNYGTRAQNFQNYNVTKTLYDGAIVRINNAGKIADVNVSNAIGLDGNITEDNISKNLLTGVTRIVNANDGSIAAMSTQMYAFNLEGILNRVFGERQAETNYLRVYGNDYDRSNGALQGVVNSLATSTVYIPYDAGKQSRLNMLFLAKNLSNYKCRFDEYDFTKPVKKATRQPVPYTVNIRDTEERLHRIATVESPFSGVYAVTADVVSLYPELGQIDIKKAVDKTSYKKGWITVNVQTYGSKAGVADFLYDVNESLDINESFGPNTDDYNITNMQKPALLPSYMQVFDVGTGSYTNMYVPASDVQ